MIGRNILYRKMHTRIAAIIFKTVSSFSVILLWNFFLLIRKKNRVITIAKMIMLLLSILNSIASIHIPHFLFFIALKFLSLIKFFNFQFFDSKIFHQKKHSQNTNQAKQNWLCTILLPLSLLTFFIKYTTFTILLRILLSLHGTYFPKTLSICPFHSLSKNKYSASITMTQPQNTPIAFLNSLSRNSSLGKIPSFS